MEIIKLMRVKHYIKNILIMLPLFFSGKLIELDSLFNTLVGFVMFSLTASCVYILNDVIDVEKDRAHSTKCKRPIASGAVSVKQAFVLIALLLLVVVGLSLFGLHDLKMLVLPLSYLMVNVLYSMGWKDIPILDVFVISLGFMLRLFYGGLLIEVKVSHWLFLTVLFGTLFLGFGKRRNELLKETKGTRKSLDGYSREYLEGALNICLGLAITFYTLWTIETSPTGNLTLFTVPVVALLGFKYSHALSNINSGDPTEIFYEERWIQIAVLILLGLFAKTLYF